VITKYQTVIENTVWCTIVQVYFNITCCFLCIISWKIFYKFSSKSRCDK